MKNKLYPTGEIYSGSKFIRKIEDDDVFEWLESLPPSSLDKIISEPFTIEKSYEKNYSRNIPLREAMDRIGFENHENRKFADCYHKYIFIEREDDHYVFACQICLNMVRQSLTASENQI